MRNPMLLTRTLVGSMLAATAVVTVILVTTTFAEPPTGQPDGPPAGTPDGPRPPRDDVGDPPPPPPRPPREGDARGGSSPRQRGPFRPEGEGPRERPSPERFVERAMRYDDDKDGKLDRDELRTFAEDLMNRFQPGPGEPPPPPREQGGREEFPEGAKRPERLLRPSEGRRPQRPDNEAFLDRPGRPVDDRPEPPPREPRRGDEAE